VMLGQNLKRRLR